MDPEQIALRDLHLPEAVGWWPPAPGWWLLFAVLLAVTAYGLVRAWRAYRRNAARRVALAELARLQQAWQADRDVIALGARLSPLLRRVMLAYAPRPEIAGLTGDAWLEWLDRGLDDRPFSAGPGRLLAELPYRRPVDLLDVDAPRLIETVRRRLATPLPEAA
jgi:hypothetical protein